MDLFICGLTNKFRSSSISAIEADGEGHEDLNLELERKPVSIISSSSPSTVQ